MSTNLKLFDEHFVGINHARTDVTAGPLAFMTPQEDNAAGRKRRESVRQWLYGYHYRLDAGDDTKKETKLVPNRSMSGFRVVDYADRWSTSNNLARIYDPNGFEVEISIPNLVDLMLTTTVEKGEIKTECIWVRDGANNRLMRADDPLVEEARKNMTDKGKPKRVRLDHEVGDIIENSYGWYLYLGYFDVSYVVAAGTVKYDAEHRAQHERMRSSDTSWIRRSRFEPRNIIGKNKAADADIGKRHVYVDYYDVPCQIEQEYFRLRKAKMTALKVVRRAEELVPAITPQSYFKGEETQYYNAAGELLGDRAKYYSTYGPQVGTDVWETNVIRLDSSDPIDPQRIPERLQNNW